MRLFITLLALLCLCNTDALAQRNRSRSSQKKEKVTVESLVTSYRFREAADLLEKEIAKTKRRRRSTEELENKLERVRSLEVMLSATEKVRFIDSVVVNKKEFLSIFHLGSDCGTMAAPGSLLPEEITKDKGIGEMAYCNGLNDKMYFSVHSGKNITGLYSSARIGNSWSSPKPLKGIAGPGIKQDYPFVLSDGVTMYYAEENEEGLGGYDIYVTRYNPDTDSYLKPENLGMPFNSMANDYMYAIDEINNLGWFATDRNQAEDTVCIYIFQPNVTRELYNPIVMGEESMRRLAMITSISDARLDKISLDKARSRLQQVVSEPNSKQYGEKTRFVINDELVYTSLSEFRNERARQIAEEWSKANNALTTHLKELEVLRMNFQVKLATDAEKKEIQEKEVIVKKLYEEVSALAKQMRMAELQK